MTGKKTVQSYLFLWHLCHLCSWARFFTMNCFSSPRCINGNLVWYRCWYWKSLWSLYSPLVVYSPRSWKKLLECCWPNDQGTNVKRIDGVIVKCAIWELTGSYYYSLIWYTKAPPVVIYGVMVCLLVPPWELTLEAAWRVRMEHPTGAGWIVACPACPHGQVKWCGH